jgi:hypothetical protein
MTTNTTILARAATALSLVIAVSGGLLIAAPAHADYGYGSPQVYTVGDQVCSSRYDPNCLLKENNYLLSSSQQYQTNYNPSTYNARYTPVPYTPYVAPRTTSYSYVPYVAPASYSYQYQYSYSYPQTYSYSYPNYTSYSYPSTYNSYEDSYDNYDSYASNDYNSYDCEYDSYGCDY